MDLDELAKTVVKTKDPVDYKAWSDAWEVLNPEELDQVGGGGHAGGKSIDNICAFPQPGGDY